MSVPDEFGITILKPGHQSVWSQWLLKKQIPDITPPNFRNRSCRDFPAVEVQTFLHILYTNTHTQRRKTPTMHFPVFLCSSLIQKNPGPPFGTDVRCDLSLRTRPGGSAAQHQPARTCPKVLELRELHQHRPFTTSLKKTIDSRLKVKFILHHSAPKRGSVLFFPNVSYFSANTSEKDVNHPVDVPWSCDFRRVLKCVLYRRSTSRVWWRESNDQRRWKLKTLGPRRVPTPVISSIWFW